MRILRMSCLVVGLVLIAVACGSGTQTATPIPPFASATSMLSGGTSMPAAAAQATATPVPQGTAGMTQQVSAGQQVFSQQCAMCHGADLQGVSGPALTQSYVASFGVAKAFADYISKQMPLTAPGSLSQEQYYAVAAYILDQDGLLPAGTTLTSQNVASISLNTAAPTPTGGSAPPSSPTPAPQSVVQAAQIPSVGNLLVDGEGYTLYINSQDGPNQSSCTGTCADEWPPLEAPSGVQPQAAPGLPGTLGAFQRNDGKYQVTYTNPPDYDRAPLYRYYADQWAGDRNGNLLLGVWNDVVLAAGSVPTPAVTGTVEAGQGAAALGVADYLLNCSPCHGIQGQGVDAPPLRNSQHIQNNTDQTIAQVIAGGIPNAEMPAWLQVNGGPLMVGQINNIVAYLRTLQGLSPVPPATLEPPEPTETPLPPGAPTPEPARPSMPGGPGAAANMAGSVSRGQPMFGLYCATCHGPEGVQGISNPDSDDLAVPPLNPLDPTIVNPDPQTFAYNLDLFVENGSVPEGEGPLLLMPAFGARNMLSQQEIADLIAYVMSLNGVTFGGAPAPSPTAAPPSATPAPAPSATNTAPTGTSQLADGGQAYSQQCAMCHGANLQGVSGPALGPRALARFGDAKALLDFIATQMPLTAPGSLSTQQNEAITAYILDQDGLLPAGTTLTEQNASSISLNQ